MMKNSSSRRSHKRLRSSSSSSSSSEDRISDLPASIIQHILSFLDAKNAIKTCVLSKRWEFLWTSIPNLLFHCVSYEYEEVHRFTSFVDKTLMKYVSPKIEKFSLLFYYYHTSRDQVDSWLQFVANHEVKDLCLRFLDNSGGYKLPKFIYANSSVRKMRLTPFHCHARLERFCWTSLRALYLTHSSFGNDTIRSILLGSQGIMSLLFWRCELRGKIIDVTSTSLRMLVIKDCLSLCAVEQINLSSPNLLLLTAVGLVDHVVFDFFDVSSLVEANMDVEVGLSSYDCEKKMLKYLIQGLSHVDKLAIGIWCLQESIRKVIRAHFPTSTHKV